MEEVEVETINLKIGEKELTLTLDEAKKLRKLLNSLFDKEIVVKPIGVDYRFYYTYLKVKDNWCIEPHFYPHPYTVNCSDKSLNVVIK